MNNWQNIIGHEWAVGLLQNAIEHDRLGHAYLFTGPAQVGKTTLARTFAQALNCAAEAISDRPCGRCRSCTLIAANRHPDVRLVLGEVSGRGKLTIKIDQIRELQQALSLTATEGRYKVAILKQFDAANLSAANAFLKTLEEPPRNVVLLLTAADADTLLPTIVSRCRTIGLRPLAVTTIEAALQQRWGAAPEQARLLAHLADGRLGWASQSLQEKALLAERESQLVLLRDVLAEKRTGRFHLADRLARKPEDLPPMLRTWLTWWRDAVLLAWSSEASNPLTNLDQAEILRQLAHAWPAGQFLASLQQTEKALWQLEHNANTRLVLENLFLVYPLNTIGATGQAQ
ncbi:MAG: DNA polymerase III subunit delta' [Chloroflexi bacterium]|nr:DNA polymerase III subunit delta' [Chloroflexota bacterium]MCI0579096.1 DNA polymerase III subunit delta' [Chloroflexota bacterium]MCI0650082.1 DNA polymerase III subunit delta' [Chloroflexota bacterium]MCI0728292.1 DNA polymerase III subunit delta' [Chloroflexota bacterium]